jgi:hypothetical protein
MHVYATDDVMPDHASRSTPEDAPYLRRFKTMDAGVRALSMAQVLVRRL